MPLCSIVKSRERSTWDGGSVAMVMVGVGGKPRIALSLVGSRTMKKDRKQQDVEARVCLGQKQSSSTDSEVRFRSRHFAGQGPECCRHKKGGSHRGEWRCSCRERTMSLYFVCVRVEAIIPVHQMSTGFPWPFFLWLRGWRSQKSRRERWIARQENGEVFLCEKMNKEWVKMMRDSHAKVDNANATVGVIVVVEDDLGFVKQVKEGGRMWEREREESVLEDNAVVEVVNGIGNGVDDGDSIMLGKREQSQRALCQWWAQRRDSILHETQSLERQTMLRWSISVQTLTSFPLSSA